MEERLYKFARVVETGSFTKAAELLHTSQPALTTAVKKLERELKTELLIRSRRSLQPTAAGMMAYETAKTIQLQADNLKLQLAEAGNHKASLRLGMIDSIAHLLFVHGNNLHRLEQTTSLSLAVDNSTRLVNYLEQDKLDLILSTRQQHLPAGLQQVTLGSEPLLLVTRHDRKTALKQSLADKTIADFLAYDQHSNTRRLIDKYFISNSITLLPSFYSTSPEIILHLVLAGRGTAVLPYLLIQPYIDNGQLAYVEVGSSCFISRSIVATQRTKRRLPAEAHRVQEVTSRQLADILTAARQLF